MTTGVKVLILLTFVMSISTLFMILNHRASYHPKDPNEHYRDGMRTVPPSNMPAPKGPGPQPTSSFTAPKGGTGETRGYTQNVITRNTPPPPPPLPKRPLLRKDCQCMKFCCKYRNDNEHDCKGNESNDWRV